MTGLRRGTLSNGYAAGRDDVRRWMMARRIWSRSVRREDGFAVQQTRRRDRAGYRAFRHTFHLADDHVVIHVVDADFVVFIDRIFVFLVIMLVTTGRVVTLGLSLSSGRHGANGGKEGRP